MAIARELISTVRSTHRLLSADGLLNDRSILAEIKNTTFLLVKRETNLRKLWATDTLFYTIPCLELIEVSIAECCDYVDECTISRTKYKLPKILEGNYGYLIQGVWSINAMGGKGKKLKEVTINRYLNLLKLPIIKNEVYYWIIDDYLYTNNPFLKSLRISAMFEEDIPNELMFPTCDCSTTIKASKDDLCKNPLDKDFPLPGYLQDQVLSIVSQKLLSRYFRVPQDQTSNQVDKSAPNTKPTD